MLLPQRPPPEKEKEKEKENTPPNPQNQQEWPALQERGRSRTKDPIKKKSPNEVSIEAEEIPIDQSTTNLIQAPAQSQPQGVGRAIAVTTVQIPNPAGESLQQQELDRKIIAIGRGNAALHENTTTMQNSMETFRSEMNSYRSELHTIMQDIMNRLDGDRRSDLRPDAGNLGMKKRWQLLRHLLDPDENKTEQKHRMTKILQTYSGSNDELIAQIRNTYLPIGPQIPLPPYTGQTNSEMDKDITEAEVRLAIGKLREIPDVPALKVLGLQIQSTRLNHNFLQTIERNLNQTIGLLKRVTNKHAGLTEQDRVRLLQAFVVSRIVYSIPYLKLTKAETDKIDILIRHAYKAALRLPPGTSTARLEGLGLHNKASELVEAHLMGQYERLARTPTGRHILRNLRIGHHSLYQDATTIPLDIHAHIIAKPLPCNMHPTHHTDWRKQRACALHKNYKNDPRVVHVDAAEYRHHEAFTAVAADKSLSLEQSHVWRQLQTGVFPNPATMNHIHPSLYPTSACPLCGAHANLAHIIWACPQDPFPEIPSEESPDQDLQARLVKRAEEVAGKPRPTASTGPPT
ncbi:hypothetical protein HPB47_027776 [Ixodes persulcatus]|uniref:Uncharacterized protein n=1 Tax=Ixodes persulcatus TaxID=34615 RepID=A0AC60PV32_IXOPE|nr:hypothetical protein HPB47_027776 [Ixodes persulcatus]